MLASGGARERVICAFTHVADAADRRPGTAPWDLVAGSGASLTREGNVGRLNQPEAASFLSPQLGWVVTGYHATGLPRQYQRIVFTDDAGRTWRVQYTSPRAT